MKFKFKVQPYQTVAIDMENLPVFSTFEYYGTVG